MKKITAIILSAILCICFCACGNNAAGSGTTEEVNLDKTVYFHECEYKVSSEWDEGDQTDSYQYYYPEKTLGIQVGYDDSVKQVSKIKDIDAYVEERINASDFEEVSNETIGVNGSEGMRIRATAKRNNQGVYLTSMVFNVPSGVVSFTVLETNETGIEIDRTAVDSLSNTLMNTIKINGVEAFAEETETETVSSDETTKEKESKTVETTEETEETDEDETDETTTSGTITQNVDSEAVEKAKTYLTYVPYSYAGLVNQMQLEGYTNEEAVKVVNACGIDWNEEAVKCAKMYVENSKSITEKELREQMDADGFTTEQIDYAIENIDLD